MMNLHHHPLDRTTHTIEMTQIDQINERLEHQVVTAADVGAGGSVLLSGRIAGGVLPGSAVLIRIDWDGDPSFPYIHGQFAEHVGGRVLWRVDVHTSFLKALDRALALHQAWGVGPPRPEQ